MNYGASVNRTAVISAPLHSAFLIPLSLAIFNGARNNNIKAGSEKHRQQRPAYHAEHARACRMLGTVACTFRKHQRHHARHERQRVFRMGRDGERGAHRIREAPMILASDVKKRYFFNVRFRVGLFYRNKKLCEVVI